MVHAYFFSLTKSQPLGHKKQDYVDFLSLSELENQITSSRFVAHFITLSHIGGLENYRIKNPG